MSTLNRRTVLRGMLGGTAITVGLPLLDCFLDSNGEALADGAPLPKTFVSWFQGLGYAPGYWEPKTVGTNYEFGVQLKALSSMRDKINIFSGLKVFLDAHPAGAHSAGPQGCLQGGVSTPSLPALTRSSPTPSAHGPASARSKSPATALKIARAAAAPRPVTRASLHRLRSTRIFSGRTSRIPTRLSSSPIHWSWRARAYCRP